MKKSNYPIISEESLFNKIHTLRNQRIMLDRDLAVLYEVKSIRLREQVKRNKERFPSNFMFQLTQDEVYDLMAQNAIPSGRHLGGTLPYAFTEHGIMMLANVLKSERAVKMSIRIIEMFIRMREFVVAHKSVLQQIEKLEEQVDQNNGDIKKIFSILRYLLAPDAKQ